jgi:hypothetical protein
VLVFAARCVDAAIEPVRPWHGCICLIRNSVTVDQSSGECVRGELLAIQLFVDPRRMPLINFSDSPADRASTMCA